MLRDGVGTHGDLKFRENVMSDSVLTRGISGARCLKMMNLFSRCALIVCKRNCAFDSSHPCRLRHFLFRNGALVKTDGTVDSLRPPSTFTMPMFFWRCSQPWISALVTLFSKNLGLRRVIAASRCLRQRFERCVNLTESLRLYLQTQSRLRPRQWRSRIV